MGYDEIPNTLNNRIRACLIRSHILDQDMPQYVAENIITRLTK